MTAKTRVELLELRATEFALVKDEHPDVYRALCDLGRARLAR